MDDARRLLTAVLILASGAACGRREARSEAPTPLRVNVMADTGRSERLHIERPLDPESGPVAKVWLAKVSPSRPPAIEPTLPVPSPEVIETAPEPPRLQVDENLKPPLVRKSGTLIPPAGKRGTVELDVRVTEEGDVFDALWAGGSNDSQMVAAAVSCALEMRFYPALQAGRPVAVWCRQRFDFGQER